MKPSRRHFDRPARVRFVARLESLWTVPVAVALTLGAGAAAARADGGHWDGGTRAPDAAADGAVDASAPSSVAADASVEGRQSSSIDSGVEAPDAPVSDAEAIADQRSTEAGADADEGVDARFEAGAPGADAGIAAPADAPPPPTVSETRPAPMPTAERGGVALHAIIGLLALLVLAYVGNHPRIRRAEEALGLRSAITAGFPFVGLGLLARQPVVGILSDRVLTGLTPLIELGLGWLGFLVGFKLDVRALDRLPRGSAFVLTVGTVVPFVVISAASAAALYAFGIPLTDGLFFRSAIVLGAAGAMMAPAALPTRVVGSDRHGVVNCVDELIGIVGLALLAAYFRPTTIGIWSMPGTAWLFVTLGMGTSLGIVLYLILRQPASAAEFVAIAVGSVAFAAGMAAYLGLSPLVICFIAGLVIANLPSDHRDPLRRTLERFEHPIFLVFLTLAGALWDPRDWRGWALLPVFIASRYLGVWLGRRAASHREPEAFGALRPRSMWVAPLSAVAIAVVVNVRTLYQGPVIPLLITAVISAALMSELIAAAVDRASRSSESTK